MPHPTFRHAWHRMRLVPVVAAFAVAALGCGALGWWQWERAHEQAVPVSTAPTAEIADALAPGMSPGLALGRHVEVTGEWAAAEAAVVWGRDVDGQPAVFLLRPLRVPAEHTGTGAEATLTVLVGWSAEDGDLPSVPVASGEVVITGHLRAGEAAVASATLPPPGVPHAFSTTSIAPSELAQVWGQPMYAAVLVADSATGDWRALPPLEPESKLDFRSVAYAIEWWIFGAFFVFIGARWIRDNGRISRQTDASSVASPEEDASHE